MNNELAGQNIIEHHIGAAPAHYFWTISRVIGRHWDNINEISAFWLIDFELEYKWAACFSPYSGFSYMWIVATNMITNKNALIKRKTGLILLGAGTNCLIYTNRKGRWAKCLNLITSERKMSQKGMHSKETLAYCVSSFPVFSGRMGFRSRLPPGRGLLKYLSMNASATSGYLPFIKFCRHFR